MKKSIIAFVIAGSMLLTSCATTDDSTNNSEVTTTVTDETVVTTTESTAATESSVQIYSDAVEEEPPVFILDYEVVTICDSEGNYDLTYEFEDSKDYQLYAEVNIDGEPVVYEFNKVSLYAYSKMEVISIDEKVYLKIDNEDLIPGTIYKEDVMLLITTPEPTPTSTPTPTPKSVAKPAQNADSGCLGGDAMTF